jgi:hypothetical protein
MANEALLFLKKLGLAEESTFGAGTVTDATKLLAMREDGIAVGLSPQVIYPGRISGRASKKTAILGTLAPKFTIPAYAFPTGLSLSLLKAAFGQVSSAEVASFTVTTGSNDKINFTEDGGAEKTATLTAGTYKMGANSGVALSLCKEIKDQLEAANDTAATYTVTFNVTTGILTVTKNSGVFVLKFSTGANAALSARTLLGFGAVDTSSAIAAVAATALVAVYDHTFTPLDATTYGLSAGLTVQTKLADGKVFDLLDTVVDVLKLSYKPNQELWIDAECEARVPAVSVATLAALTEETTSPFLYSQLGFTVGGSDHKLSALEVSYGNNYKKDLFVNSQYRSKFPRGGFREVSGTFTMELADSRAYDIYTAFLAGTQPALVATFTAAASAIKTGFTYTWTQTMPKVQYNLESIPGGGGEATPDAPIPFMMLDDGSIGEMRIVVRNNEATV